MITSVSGVDARGLTGKINVPESPEKGFFPIKAIVMDLITILVKYPFAGNYPRHFH